MLHTRLILWSRYRLILPYPVFLRSGLHLDNRPVLLSRTKPRHRRVLL